MGRSHDRTHPVLPSCHTNSEAHSLTLIKQPAYEPSTRSMKKRLASCSPTFARRTLLLNPKLLNLKPASPNSQGTRTALARQSARDLRTGDAQPKRSKLRFLCLVMEKMLPLPGLSG